MADCSKCIQATWADDQKKTQVCERRLFEYGDNNTTNKKTDFTGATFKPTTTQNSVATVAVDSIGKFAHTFFAQTAASVRSRPDAVTQYSEKWRVFGWDLGWSGCRRF